MVRSPKAVSQPPRVGPGTYISTMRYRSDLERLATLDAATIEMACTDSTAVADLIAHGVEEYLEYDLHADEAEAAGDTDLAHFYRQEASAWRSTVATLRMMAVEPADRRAARSA